MSRFRLEKLGRVARLRRYPVKSMRGEDLETATFETVGVSGDRMYAFYDLEDKNPTSFPWGWLTARKVPEMLLYLPKYRENEELDFFKDGRNIERSEFESYVAGKYSMKIGLKKDPKHNYDSSPVSLIGLDTINQLGKESMNLEPERFRANIYAEWESRTPFFEDYLVGRELSIGEEVKITVTKKNSRCEIPTFHPETAKESRIVLETITRNHKGCTGVYARIVATGRVNVGDSIYSSEKV